MSLGSEMADRNVIDGAQQPADWLEQILARHKGREGALLPILHDVQAARGHVPADAMVAIAEALSLSRAEIHGVVSFYHDFRTAPGARRQILLCRAEACQAVGCERLVEETCAALGIAIDAEGEPGSEPAAGARSDIELKTVYCLGNCALGPSALVDGALRGRVTAAALLAEVGS